MAPVAIEDTSASFIMYQPTPHRQGARIPGNGKAARDVSGPINKGPRSCWHRKTVQRSSHERPRVGSGERGQRARSRGLIEQLGGIRRPYRTAGIQSSFKAPQSKPL